MLRVIYAECPKQTIMLSVIILHVAMLSAVMLNVVMLSVVAPLKMVKPCFHCLLFPRRFHSGP